MFLKIWICMYVNGIPFDLLWAKENYMPNKFFMSSWMKHLPTPRPFFVQNSEEKCIQGTGHMPMKTITIRLVTLSLDMTNGRH